MLGEKVDLLNPKFNAANLCTGFLQVKYPGMFFLVVLRCQSGTCHYISSLRPLSFISQGLQIGFF